MRTDRIKLPRYAVLIDVEAGAFGAVVPDLPGCIAMGDTIDGALRNAAAAAADWLKDAAASGEPMPPARTIEQLKSDHDVNDALLRGATLMPLSENLG